MPSDPKGRQSTASDEKIRSQGHKFKVGQTVRLESGARAAASPEQVYRVVGTLPARNGYPQYRVRNSGEAYERVVTEDQLARLQDADVDQNQSLREKTFGKDA